MIVTLIKSNNNNSNNTIVYNIKKKIKKFYKYNFFLFYLIKIGYYLYRFIKLKSFCLFSWENKQKRRNRRSNRFIKKKKYKKFSILKKNIKKWWFYFKKKKPCYGRTFNFNFWLNQNKLKYTTQCVKFNKCTKKMVNLFNKKYFSSIFFMLLNDIFEDYKNLYFFLDSEVETFSLDLWDYVFNYNELFYSTTQFFFNFFFYFNNINSSNNQYMFNTFYKKKLFVYNFYDSTQVSHLNIYNNNKNNKLKFLLN